MNKVTLTPSKFLLLSVIALLPGCGPAKIEQPETTTHSSSVDASVNDDVLLSVTDERGQQIPLVTVKHLHEHLDMVAEANPQVKMVLEIMPDAERDIFFKGLKRNKILREWAKRNKIDDTAEYQRDLTLIMDMGRSSLDAQHFQKGLTIKITDTDVRKYYDEHKDEMPGLIASPEGVKALGVMFENSDKANDFLARVKTPGADFTKVAKELNVEVDDFGGGLSQRSFVDAALKDKILGVKKFPATELIKVDDKKIWVVRVLAKEKAQYVPFDQVKENLRSMLNEQEMGKAFEKEVDKLEKEYKVVEHSAYFEKKKQQAEEERKQAETQQATEKDDAGDGHEPIGGKELV